MRAQLTNITVQFGSLKAVDDVSTTFEAGEVHAVLGENGAGKSTLMNVLFGLVSPSAGSIAIEGEEVRWRSPQDAIRRGLGMVHQHFMLQRQMTVIENIVLCSEPTKRLGFVDFDAARRSLAEVAKKHGISVDLEALVETLSVGQRQVVEILKVLYREARLLIFDEPTAVLTPLEKDNLFNILRSFAASGKAIVIITHKLDEVMEIADRVTVMRGGRMISSGELRATSREQIAREIIGSELPPPLPHLSKPAGKIVLAVKSLQTKGQAGQVGPVDLEVRSGEIVGIAGVSGNGQSELVQALTGLRPVTSGHVQLLHTAIDRFDVAARRHAGMSYIPEDRENVGLALAATVSENANAGRDDAKSFCKGPFLDRYAMETFARSLITAYRIKVGGASAQVSTMSGGNKQKLLVGRELSRKTPLVIAENPTWGVDIGAIELIHRELLRMRDDGHAILLISTELDEVLELSDRIYVMYSGQLSEEVPRGLASREKLGSLMTSKSNPALEVTI